MLHKISQAVVIALLLVLGQRQAHASEIWACTVQQAMNASFDTQTRRTVFQEDPSEKVGAAITIVITDDAIVYKTEGSDYANYDFIIGSRTHPDLLVGVAVVQIGDFPKVASIFINKRLKSYAVTSLVDDAIGDMLFGKCN